MTDVKVAVMEALKKEFAFLGAEDDSWNKAADGVLTSLWRQGYSVIETGVLLAAKLPIDERVYDRPEHIDISINQDAAHRDAVLRGMKAEADQGIDPRGPARLRRHDLAHLEVGDEVADTDE